MTFAGASATVPDLLRLLAIPIFGYAAIYDLKTRRVSSGLWIPLGVLGVILLAWDGWRAWQSGGIVWTNDFLIPAAISFGVLVPLAYLFWWFGGFGGADAKAILILALVFPMTPAYVIGATTFPITPPPLGTFAVAIVTNAVLVAVIIPILLAIRNGLAGRISPVMFVGWPVAVDRVPQTYGTLLQTPTGLTTSGLDLDALRMYLRWRGITLDDLRAEPNRYRDPTSLPETPNPPTDGAVERTDSIATDNAEPTGDHESSPEDESTREHAATANRTDDVSSDGSHPANDANANGDRSMITTDSDSWGADAFLTDIEGTAYGTSPEQLRRGLDVLSTEDRVWISPGTPFIVPIVLGLVIALVYGDVFVAILL